MRVTRTGVFVAGAGNMQPLVRKRIEDLITPAVLESAAAFLRQIVLDQFSVSPQPDLVELGHPYAKRLGKIQYAPSSGGSPYFRGDRRVLVHVDEAHVRGAVYSVIHPSRGSVEAGLEPTEEVLWVIDGTEIMLPRDTIGETFRDQGVQRAIVRHLAIAIKKKR